MGISKVTFTNKSKTNQRLSIYSSEVGPGQSVDLATQATPTQIYGAEEIAELIERGLAEVVILFSSGKEKKVTDEDELRSQLSKDVIDSLVTAIKALTARLDTDVDVALSYSDITNGISF